MINPLQGQTVVVTRAANQQGAARQLLEQRGATVMDLPALVIGPPDHWGPLAVSYTHLTLPTICSV